MLLSELNALYEQLVGEDRLPPVGFETKRIRFIIGLDLDGKCQFITDTSSDKLKRTVPNFRRSGKGPPALLVCDNGQFVLGLPKTTQPKDRANAQQAHLKYIERLNSVRAAIAENDEGSARLLAAIAAFVTGRDDALVEFETRAFTLKPNDKGEIQAAGEWITFVVDGVDPLESPSIRSWWAEFVNQDLAAEASGLCQVLGRDSKLARKMPGVRVVPGTPQALISANFPAFERYNASHSTGAQIAVPVAIRSHQALNWLLADEHHHRRIGDITYAWWLDGDIEFDPFNLIAEPRAEDVKALLERPWTGRPGMTPSASFRLLALSLTEGRIVIRLDHVTTLAQMQARTESWLDLVARKRQDGSPWWPTIWSLAEAIVPPGQGATRKAQRDRAIEALARTAIIGQPLPRPILAALVDRFRAVPIPRKNDKIYWPVLGSRLALLSLYRNRKEEIVTQPSAGEICGRMLAQLDNAQHRALGNINRGVVDRFYAGASIRPQSVFPSLLRSANAHLAKIGRQPGGTGAQIAIKRRLGELAQTLTRLGGFPRNLNLEGQAEFALGFWDERQARFDRRQSHPEATIHEEII